MKFFITGDFCIKNMESTAVTDEWIDRIVLDIKKIVAEHDLSMYNNETVFTNTGTPIAKSGPNLKSPHKAIDIVRKSGFDIAACANNHIGDYAGEGVLETIDFLKDNGFQVVGAGKNLDVAVAPLHVEKCGIKIAIVNCAENEFGIAEREKPGAAPMDFYSTGHIVRGAKQKVDKVVAFVHGGNEHNPVPRPGIMKFCHHLVECGADAVIVAHSHCPQGIEVYNNVPICYSVGNFYFPKVAANGMWEYGYSVSLQIKKDAPITVEIMPHKQTEEQFSVMEGKEKEYFFQYFEQLCRLIKDDEQYESITNAWGKYYMNISNDWFKGKNSDDPQDEYTLFLRNSYTCESHNELMTRYYKNFCEGNFDEETERYIEMIRKLQNYEVLQ